MSDYQFAKKLFNEGDYSKALKVFDKLLEKYPRDPDYQYYTGVCLILTNHQTVKAMDLLFKASLKNVPENVYYFLGRAYMQSYQFEEAIQSFERYKLYIKRSDYEIYNPDKAIRHCQNAQLMLNVKTSVNGLAHHIVSTTLLDEYYNKLAIGDFVKTPALLNADAEYENEKTIMFLPKNDEKTFVSGITKNSKTGMDLFELKKESDGEWGPPTFVEGGINTEYDDIFPFYDSKNKVLYFSNDGVESIGGTDIFTSQYDENLKKWSKPKNLGFPINSPANEYLFVVSEGRASFVTERFGSGDSVTIVEVEFPLSKEKLVINNKEEILSIAQLTLADKIIEEEVKEVEEKEVVIIKQPSSYQEIIREALHYQMIADSCLISATNLKIERKNVKDADKRRVLFSRIKKFEEQSVHYQVKADELYLKAREKELLKGVFQHERKTQSNIEALFPEPENNASENIEEEIEPVEIVEAPKNPYAHLVDMFSIQPKTPYSDVNPIPIDVKLDERVIYKIQLGAFSKKVAWNQFGGLSPVTGEFLEDRGITKYFVGLFTSIKACRNALDEVRTYGYKDAYIVSYFEGRKVPVSRAVEIEESLKATK